MKKLTAFALMIAVLTLTALPVTAQEEDPCIPDGYRTQTQGGWSNNCHGNNPGCVRDNNWDTAFPSGLTIGGIHTIYFTSSAAVKDFLPAGGPSASLTSSHTDPTTSNAGVFAGQVTALAVSLGMVSANVPGFGPLGDLYYKFVHPQAGVLFSGMTVQQLFDLANEVLGGDTSNLPAGASISDLSDAITTINENFVDGEQNHGNLVEEDCDKELPVELAGFEAVPGDAQVALYWSTASESDNDYFEILRDGLLVHRESASNEAVGSSYSWTEFGLTNGRVYNYTLVNVDLDGSRSEIAEAETAPSFGSVSATEYALYQNYPNPFNPSTSISFNLPEDGYARLTIFDMLGREIAVLVNGTVASGLHSVEFNAANLSAGTYFYQLTAGNFSAVRKLMFVK